MGDSSVAPFILAVDGGGTKTAAALMTREGAVLAACRAGPANLYRDPATGLAAITAAWREVCAMAGLDAERTAPATVISAGLAGVTGRAQRNAFQGAFAGFAARRLSSDGYTTFLGVFATGPGALVAVGTGVVAYSRAAGERPRLRSGWGFPVADRGSGAWLGLRLVGEYLDWLDGAVSMPASGLWPEVAARLGPGREATLAWLRDARAAEFAALAPAVVAAARAEDALATALVAEGAGHLVRLARALEPDPAAPLALGGGLAEVYRPALAAALGEESLLAVAAAPEPLRGAWLIATGQVPPEFADVD